MGTAYPKATETISGSTLRVNEMLIPFDEAINAATINPARVLKLDDRKGKIASGYDADIVILKDNCDVRQTYILGKAYL